MLLDIHISNHNNNLKLIYIKIHSKMYIYSKIIFLLKYFPINIIKNVFNIYIRKIQYKAQFQTPT